MAILSSPYFASLARHGAFSGASFALRTDIVDRGTKGLLRECLKMLPERIKNIRTRGDSSFLNGDFLEEMERKGIEYAIAAKLYAPIQNLLGELHY